MKKSISYGIPVLFALLLLSTGARSQFVEDVLRLSFPGFGVGARSLGMGMAYTGVANDFSASYWNPAGLGQMRLNEVTLGLDNISYGNSSTFFGSGQSFSNSATNLNGLGLVYAVPTAKGSFVVAIGYGRQMDFTTGLSFDGFNPNSSIIQFWAPNGQPYASYPYTIAEGLALASADTITGNFVSPILNRVTQTGKILEGGGLNHVSASAAIEAGRDLYLGATLNFLTGSYSYTRNYYEYDLSNVWSTPPDDFSSLSWLETVESDISGFTANLGMLYKFGRNSRVGISIKTPSWITVRETYSQSGTSYFDNGDIVNYTAADGVNNEYDITTPFVFSAGISQEISDLMIAASIDYTDWSQMEFRNADQRLLALNTDIKQIFGQTINMKIGGEYEIPNAGLRLRAGYAYFPSPYKGDPSSRDHKYITGGLGFIIQNSIAIDFAYAHGAWENYIVNYDNSSTVNESVTTNNIVGTVSYRF